MPVEDRIVEQRYEQDGYWISTDRDLLQIQVIHDYLANESYWAQGTTETIVADSITHSFCFGLYEESGRQIGFARAVTDYTKFAYLADVFVVPNQQGHGLGTWLISTILAHPRLSSITRWTLYTTDAHGLYSRFGFVEEPEPWKHMVLRPHLPNSTG